MLPQGVLGFQYEADRSGGGLTRWQVCRCLLIWLRPSVLAQRPPDRACAGRQGWLDIQMVLALFFLDLADATASKTLNVWRPTVASRRS
jgi:hypothetical protein